MSLVGVVATVSNFLGVPAAINNTIQLAERAVKFFQKRPKFRIAAIIVMVLGVGLGLGSWFTRRSMSPLKPPPPAEAAQASAEPPKPVTVTQFAPTTAPSPPKKKMRSAKQATPTSPTLTIRDPQDQASPDHQPTSGMSGIQMGLGGRYSVVQGNNVHDQVNCGVFNYGDDVVTRDNNITCGSAKQPAEPQPAKPPQ